MAKRKRSVDFGKKQEKWIKPPVKISDTLWVRYWFEIVDKEDWRDLSINARRIIDALLCHLIRSGQSENGKLEMSYSQFAALGVRGRSSVSSAIREVVAAGFVEVETRHGRATLYGLPHWRDEKKPFMVGGVVTMATRPFFWVPVSVLEDPAWFEMPINARRIIERLLIENTQHRCGEENGELKVSYRQFEGLGVSWRMIKPTLSNLAGTGLVAITGGQRHGSQYLPNKYRLTFLGTLDGPATWRKSDEEAECNLVPLAKPTQSERLKPCS